MWVVYFFEKYLFTLFKFFGFIIKQNPTPQLNVLSISFSSILLFLSQRNIFKVLIFFKSISAQSLLGIILLILSSSPPPVIFAHPFIKFLLINFRISMT